MESAQPLRLGHPPRRIAGHHVPWTERITDSVEVGANLVAKRGEIVSMSVGVVIVGEDQRIVLIGREPHLSAPMRAQYCKGIANRWRPKLFLRKRHQASGDSIGHGGQQLGDLLPRITSVNKPAHNPPCVLSNLRNLGDIALSRQRRRRVHGIGVQTAQEVANDNHADHPRPIVHRQMMVTALGHQQHGLEDQQVGTDSFRVPGHHFAYETLRRLGFCQHSTTEVTVSDDADERALVGACRLHHEQTGDIPLRHNLRRLLYCRISTAGHQRCFHQVRNPCAQRLRCRSTPQLRCHCANARVFTAVIAPDLYELVIELVKDLLGDHQEYAVLHCRHRVQRGVTAQQCRIAEMISHISPVQQRASWVKEIHHAGANNETAVVIRTRPDNLRSTTGIAHGQKRWDSRALFIVEVRKGASMAEEVCDFRKLDGHGVNYPLFLLPIGLICGNTRPYDQFHTQRFNKSRMAARRPHPRQDGQARGTRRHA